MNFSEAESYLFSLGNEVETMKLGLANITALLEALGKPQERYKKVQVAGTNGKGSVCAFLGSICRQASIRSGVFTSPHLISVRERININGTDISESDFARFATRVRETSESLVTSGTLVWLPTFFEQVTAIALFAFAEANVEVAILETGLGGRFDATTAANAEIAAITRIDLDHQDYLGDTIEKIAAEKAAIIRAGSKVVVGNQRREAESVILGRCAELAVEPVRLSQQVTIVRTAGSGYPVESFSIKTKENSYEDLGTRLLGSHQAENAAIAIAVAEILADRNTELSESDIRMGIALASHPGRLERIGPYLLDGAHNPLGARALAAFLDENRELGAEAPTMIFGAMEDKNITEMLAVLLPKVARIVLTAPNNSRAVPPNELVKHIPARFGKNNVVLADSVENAVAAAGKNKRTSFIIVTGSLYLVGEVRSILKNRQSLEFRI